MFSLIAGLAGGACGMLIVSMLELSPDAISVLSLSDFVAGYVDLRRGEVKRHRAMELTLRRMAAALPAGPVSSLRRVDIAGFVQARRRSGAGNSTINCELLTLSGAINYVNRRLGWGLANPVPGQYLRWPHGRVRWLAEAEAVRLLAAAAAVKNKNGHVLRDFIALNLNTGMRKDELLRLTWDRVRPDSSSLILRAEDTKNTRPRVLPLNVEARKALESRAKFREAYCPESPWVFASKDGGRVVSVYRAFWAALDAANIEDCHIHDLRHTFASWLVIKGESLYVVRDLLGHSSIKQTERYAHLAQGPLIAAVQRLDR